MPVHVDQREGEERQTLRHLDPDCATLKEGVPRKDRKKVPNTERVRSTTERCPTCWIEDTASKRKASKEKETPPASS